MSVTQPPADAVVEQRARKICERLGVDPDEITDPYGPVHQWDLAAYHIAEAIATLRPAIIRQCAAYLDSYAGGHYMAESCADALRELAQREEPSRG